MSKRSEFHAHAFANHRKRVRAAKHIIDDSSPEIEISSFSGFSKIKEEVYTYFQHSKENAFLLLGLNRNSFRVHSEENHGIENSNFPLRIEALNKIEQKNMQLGKILMCARPEVDSWQTIPLRQDIERRKKKAKKVFHVPYKILEKYSEELMVPKDPLVTKTLLRPKIWLYLEIKGFRPLGLVVVELYTEAAPLVVLELVRLCKEEKNDSFKFVRIFPGLWVEGTAQLRENTLLSNKIEFDKRVLDHNKMGTLSFSMDILKMFCDSGFLNFSISVKPLHALNGHRVAFGRVIRGRKIIQCMQDYGTKNGKTSKEVRVSKCGWYQQSD